jgi:S-adenosylmethionine hydrolase
MAPVVALLTDFGLQDAYVGTLKGAVLSVCPEATLVDLVHELPAHDVTAGALALESAYRYFPAGTAFVAVVDPGVGSLRRALAVAAGGFLFVAPDNGLLTAVFEAEEHSRTHAITDERLFRRPVSAVFHGRDVFGPVAAHLARGLRVEDVGPPVTDPVRLPWPLPRRLADGAWVGEVVLVDRFGTLITNLRGREVGSARFAEAAGRRLPVVRAYADVAAGEGCALLGSGGRLELAVNQGRADERLGLGRGSVVRVPAADPPIAAAGPSEAV